MRRGSESWIHRALFLPLLLLHLPSHVLSSLEDENFIHIPSSDHSKSNEKAKSKRALEPGDDLVHSGQHIRLRGPNRTLGEGRVEVRRADGRWGLVCDDFFDLADAHVVCRQLGFQRGAEKALRESAFGSGLLRTVVVDDVACKGDESALTDCPFARNPDCNPKTEAAAVVCRPNYASRCLAGGVLHKDKCYYFYDEELKSYTEEPVSWYTSGRQRNKRWRWEVPGGVTASSFSKWSRSVGSGDCLVLLAEGWLPGSEYHFWRADDCEEKRPFICQAPALDIGCYNESSPEAYRGKANVTQMGHSCMTWNHPDILWRGRVFPEQEEWEHSECRNPDGDSAPWCMVSPSQFDLCDIPTCHKEPGTSLFRLDHVYFE